MKYFLLLFAVIALSGCYAQKDCTQRDERKAVRHFVKALDRCERKVAEQAGLMWPVRVYDSTVIKYLPGVETVITDTVTGTDTVSNEVIRTVTRTVYRVDTFYQKSDKQGENTANISALNAKIKAQSEEMGTLKNEVSSKTSTQRMLWWAVGILSAYTVGRWIVRIWGVKLP